MLAGILVLVAGFQIYFRVAILVRSKFEAVSTLQSPGSHEARPADAKLPEIHWYTAEQRHDTRGKRPDA
ncbi:hypothetical protein NP233_g7019 [Leucocoprinus birnbaumii]|uniref:Uncharacterized protein n=1 Tax=Leucocoprinus birnbaumii TaxID=56174 RepID=A0AAD5VQ04_9AGAR|nr:hypothetical protein NP233_g7019 [Leucocoprinus birnbaumii]